MEPLYVVTAISNPGRYKSRYELYRKFAQRMLAAGAILMTVEAAFGDRPHEITDGPAQMNVQVRIHDELWHKENLLNIGIARLPAAAQYIATIDADLTFARQDWAQETVQQLQHSPVVQMYSEISHLGPREELLGHGLSFEEAWHRGYTIRTPRGSASWPRFFHYQSMARLPAYPGADTQAAAGGNQELGSPGGAWAYRRAALDKLGGLIDYSVIGCADYFMAAGLHGIMNLTIPDGVTAGFRSKLLGWQERANRWIRHDVGVMPGLLLHHWHGKLSERGYGSRNSILIDHEFNPSTDIVYDSQGVIHLHDDGSRRMARMRDDLRGYVRSRNEDSIDV